jgi:pyrroloquinoline-quinone synthase
VIAEAPWNRDDFKARLQAVGDARYHDKHPFHRRMHTGELKRRELQGWVLNRFYYQINIPVKDAIILSKLPTRDDRRAWIQRIIDHDGRQGDEGGIESWLRLGEAVGLKRSVLLDSQAVLPGVRFAVDSYVNFCRNRPWQEAVAASLTELFAPDLLSRRIEVIERRYPWVDPSGLEYFRRRLTQQPREIDHVLGLVINSAISRQDQEQAIHALEFKCEVLWSLLDAVELAYSEGGET